MGAAREAQRKAEREARAAKKQAEKETRAAQRAALREERAKAKKQAAEERKAAGRGRKGTAAAQQVDEATRPSVSADTGAAKVDEEPGGKSPASKSRTKGSKKNAPAPGETPEVQRTRAKRATGFKPPESAAAPASAVAKKPAKRAAPSRSEAKEGAPKSPSATEHPGTAATPAAKAPTQDAPVTEGHRGAHQQPAPKAKEPGPAEQTTPTLKDEAAPRAGSEKAPQPPQHEENAPKAVKAKAKASVPENAQPIVRDPGGAPTKSNAPKPSRPVSSKGEAVTGALGKADAVLGAVRDFQQYQADGASTGEALTRAAGTLAANLKGGPAAAIVNSANAYDNARKSGQGKVEAMATAIGTGVAASSPAGWRRPGRSARRSTSPTPRPRRWARPRACRMRPPERRRSFRPTLSPPPSPRAHAALPISAPPSLPATPRRSTDRSKDTRRAPPDPGCKAMRR